MTHKRLAAVNTLTGAVTAWSPNVWAEVRSIEVSSDGTRLYIGGHFTTVNGQPRNKVAAFNLTTGSLISGWDPIVTQESGQPCPPRCFPTVLGLALSPDGQTLYFGGAFAFVDGVPRNSAAAVRASDGSLLPWDPNVFQGGLAASLNTIYEVEYYDPPGSAPASDQEADLVHLCGDFWALGVGAGRRTSPNIAAVDPASGIVDDRFVATTDGAVNDCYVSPEQRRLFFGGHFEYAGGPNAAQKPPPPTASQRFHMAVVDAETGVLDPWDPRANSVPGLYALAATATRVAGGGDFTLINFQDQQGFAQWTLDPDLTVPSAPGKPSGTSTSPGTINLTWASSVDPDDESVTYRIYRDGGASPVGSVTSSSSTTVAFLDEGLSPGSGHVYAIEATDAAGNVSPLSPPSQPIVVIAPDVDPPSQPGKPSGSSSTPSTIQLTWGASLDAVDTTLTYRVYRDGGPSPVGQVTSSSTTTVSFSDTGLDPGSSHTYVVDAEDDSGNVSDPSAASDPITVVSAVTVFSDHFDAGLGSWTQISGIAIDAGDGDAAPPSARADAAGTKAVMYHDLGSNHQTLCLSENVKLSSIGANSVVLMRLRTAANGAIGRVYVSSSRVIWLRSDVSGVQLSSGVALPLGTWSNLEICGTIGTAGSWQLYLDGTSILGPWTSDSGTTQIGRVQIGDDAVKTFSLNVDDIVADNMAG